MSEPASPLSPVRQNYLIGLEGTRGTAIVPATSILVSDPKFANTTPTIDRKVVRTGGSIKSSRGPLSGTLAGKTEFRPNTAAGLEASLSILMQISGWGLNAGVYSPCGRRPADQKTATVYGYQDGRLKALSGCYGTGSIEADAGGPIYTGFNLNGVWVAPTDAALSVTQPSATLPALFADSVLTINGITPNVSKIAIDFGVSVQPRKRTATGCSGILHYLSSAMQPTIKIDPEAMLVAGNDVYGQWLAATSIAFSWVIGTTAGKIITISAPTCQIANPPAEGNRDEIMTDEIILVPRDEAGNDTDITITCS